MLLPFASVGLFQQVIHVLHDGDEDTEVVHRFHQLANHVDGLWARVEVDAYLSPFSLMVPCSKVVMPRTTVCPDSLYI